MELSEKNQKLVAKAITEKWNMIAMGCLPLSTASQVTGCPLCSEYHHNYTGDLPCVGCPIKEATGKAGCCGTPIDWFGQNSVLRAELILRDLSERHHYVQLGLVPTAADSYISAISRKTLIEAMHQVEKEIEFLESLLPEDHPLRTGHAAR